MARLEKMTNLERLDAIIQMPDRALAPVSRRVANELLLIGEAALEGWVLSRGEVPTHAKTEGFRLLALHRQGARGEPSFNACRETCRELVYHRNCVVAASDSAETAGLHSPRRHGGAAPRSLHRR